MKYIAEVDNEFLRKYRRHLRVGEFIHRHPRIRRIIFRIGGAFRSIEDDYERHQSKLLFHDRSSQSPPTHNEDRFGEKYGFGDIESLIGYARQIEDPNFSPQQPAESYVLYQEQEKMLGDLLRRDDNIKKVLNFGVCYPHIDAILAVEFPNVEFHGIDLSKACKAINDCIFGQIDNLHFHAGDVFDLLNVDGFRGDVLHHSRILLLLPQSFVEGLFKAARDAGFMYLVGFEQFGLSSETLEPYEFSDEDKESVYWRDRMLIHNYPGIAIKLGAEIIDAHILKTANRSPDYRVFCYIAKF